MFDVGPKLRKLIERSLLLSLKSIGFEYKLIKELCACLDDFDFENFKNEFAAELDNVHEINFYQKMLPDFYVKYVIPYIPASNVILDLGCGTGILAKTLSGSEKFEKVIGIDVVPYPEWASYKSKKVNYKIIKETEFLDFANEVKPEAMVLTWVLHHMEYDEQKIYISNIKDVLKKGSIVVILEDSYSEKLIPETSLEWHNSLISLSEKDRHTFMSVLDWISNRVLSRKRTCPVTFTYRTLESWVDIFEHFGFEVLDKRYIGFPLPKNIHVPQSLFILRSTSSK